MFMVGGGRPFRPTMAAAIFMFMPPPSLD